MNDIIKNLTEVKLVEPLTSYRDGEEGLPGVEYCVQWALEHDRARKFVTLIQEQAAPAFATSSSEVSEHVDRVKGVLLPSLVSKLKIGREDGDPIPFQINSAQLSDLHDIIDAFFVVPLEKLLPLADLEIAKVAPTAHLCFWLIVVGKHGQELVEFFDKDTHTIQGPCTYYIYAKIAVAADTPIQARFLTQEENKALLGKDYSLLTS